MFPGGIGFKSKKLESQTMLTLVEVKTGLQKVVATGSARKKDKSIIGGALMSSGIGALGGGYASTDIGKITSFAFLDAFRKLARDAQGRIARPIATSAAPRPGCEFGCVRSGSCSLHRQRTGSRNTGAVGGEREWKGRTRQEDEPPALSPQLGAVDHEHADGFVRREAVRSRDRRRRHHAQRTAGNALWVP
jgi:hypothetical protein